MISKSGARLLRPEAVDALRREILPLALVVTPNLHGAGPLLAARFPLHSISTDLHQGNVKGPVFTLARTMAKFLHLGLSLPEVVRLATLGPATAIGRAEEFGTLRPGACADITVFRVLDGPVTYVDSEGASEQGTVDLAAVHTVRAGRLIGTAS